MLKKTPSIIVPLLTLLVGGAPSTVYAADEKTFQSIPRAPLNQVELSDLPELVPLTPVMGEGSKDHKRKKKAPRDPPVSANSNSEFCRNLYECYQSGRTNYDQGRFEEAATDFMTGYNLTPNHNNLAAKLMLYNAALASELAGDPDTALGLYEKYLSVRPDAPEVVQIQSKTKGLTKFAKGINQYNLGNYNEALRLFEEAKIDLPHGLELVPLCEASAQVYEARMKDIQSLTEYQRCLAVTKAKPNPPQYVVDRLEAKILELFTRVVAEDSRQTTTSTPVVVSIPREQPSPSFLSAHLGSSASAALGLVSLGTALFLYNEGWANYRKLDATCHQNGGCSNAQMSISKEYFIGFDVALAVGIVSLAASPLLFYRESSQARELSSPANGDKK